MIVFSIVFPSSFFRSFKNTPTKFSNPSKSHIDLVSYGKQDKYLLIYLCYLLLNVFQLFVVII